MSLTGLEVFSVACSLTQVTSDFSAFACRTFFSCISSPGLRPLHFASCTLPFTRNSQRLTVPAVHALALRLKHLLDARHMAANHGLQDEHETTLLYALDATDEYLCHQHALAMALKDGYLNISRARYSMGATSVGESQYASEMEPLLHVVAGGKDRLGQLEWRLERRACSEKLAGRPASRGDRPGTAGQEADSVSEEVPACAVLPAEGQKHAGGGSSSSGAAEAGYSSLISEFAARFACSDDSAGAAAQRAADRAAPEPRAAAHSPASSSGAEAPPPAAGQAESCGALYGASVAQAERPAEAGSGPACQPGQQRSAAGDCPARELRARRDPLLWFGALVPPHLRAGQVRL